MSVKRYGLVNLDGFVIGMKDDKKGDYVLHSDYAALEAELKRLRSGEDKDLTAAYMLGFERGKEAALKGGQS